MDTTSRLWLSTESGSNVRVYYSDPPYTGFSGPIVLASNIGSDDITVVTALRDFIEEDFAWQTATIALGGTPDRNQPDR